jgi:hypothetical protein
MKKTFFFLNFTILFFVFGCVLSVNQVLAWTEPVGVPPQNNVPAPINVSVDPQIKKGTLGLLGQNPTDLYGLFLATGKTASIKSVNKTNLSSVEVNNAKNGVYVTGSAASFSGVRSEVKGLGSVGGYFVNNDLSGQGVYAWALDTGMMVKGGHMGLYVSSDNIGVNVKTVEAETRINSLTSRTVKLVPVYEGVYSQLTTTATTNPGIYPIAVGGYYDSVTFGELGQKGIGVRGKGSVAGSFEGAVNITGKLNVSSGCVGCVADLAEEMLKQEDVEAGDIVATTKELKLFKATKKDATVVGVVSENPFLVLNQKENGAPLALSGIVKVKVNSENGNIKAGDFITASSVPGFGMKGTDPGTVVGKALADFSGKEGKINILVNISYFPGLNCQK